MNTVSIPYAYKKKEKDKQKEKKTKNQNEKKNQKSAASPKSRVLRRPGGVALSASGLRNDRALSGGTCALHMEAANERLRR
jgi:hypothetical protein